MSNIWIKIKRILIVIPALIVVLLGILGIVGIVIFQKPEMKSVYWYMGLGLLDLLLIAIGLFLIRVGLYGSEKDVSDVS